MNESPEARVWYCCRSNQDRGSKERANLSKIDELHNDEMP